MKRSFHILFALISASLIFATISPILAGGSKKKPTPPEYHPPTIASVSANRVTVNEEKTTRTFTITQFTEITVNGQRAGIADLKPGMTVNVTLGTDPTRASRIVATGAPAEGSQKKK